MKTGRVAAGNCRSAAFRVHHQGVAQLCRDRFSSRAMSWFSARKRVVCRLPSLADFDADARLRLPMLPGQRSLNLSNAVAVTVFEAWRQQGAGRRCRLALHATCPHVSQVAIRITEPS
jgi:tRNA(Leu) C34 or U34 (ribose-2'-O)-methylase TrmL